MNKKPTKWQRDAENVETSRVQFWRDGVMITAQMTQARAQAMIRNKTAYVISAQAVGVLSTDGTRRG